MIPPALKDLLASERGFAGGTLIVAATAMVFVGKLSADAWQEYTRWIFTAWVGAKTLQGTMVTYTNAKASAWESMPHKE